MQTLVESSLGYIRELSHQHAPGTATHHHGEADHLAYLERPFLQALAAPEALMFTYMAAGLAGS